MFKFIKAVSDTVFDMINAVYHVKYSVRKILFGTLRARQWNDDLALLIIQNHHIKSYLP